VGSLLHILHGFSDGFHHRRELYRVMEDTARDASILKLDPNELHTSGISALALDFDGVLAHHGAEAPLAEAVEWIKHCESVFGGNRLFILSNKPTDSRKAWFNLHFPEIRFISGVRKKPFPDGLNKIGELSGVPLSSILMVDDRLLTGCQAAINAGSRPCYIRRPYRSFRHRPLAELFFSTLRLGERMFIRLSTIF
jgi:predicted HAD superfamily phosphohydrolase YqeG